MSRSALRRLVIVFALLGATLPFGTRPSAAHTDACAALAVMVTDDPVSYPFTGSTANTSFHLVSIGGQSCLDVWPIFMSGSVSGDCLSMTGTGFAGPGHSFAFAVTGTTIVFSGNLIGGGQITADVGHDCVAGATQFRVLFTALMVHL